jgi:hypothetical protein
MSVEEMPLGKMTSSSLFIFAAKNIDLIHQVLIISAFKIWRSDFRTNDTLSNDNLMKNSKVLK